MKVREHGLATGVKQRLKPVESAKLKLMEARVKEHEKALDHLKSLRNVRRYNDPYGDMKRMTEKHENELTYALLALRKYEDELDRAYRT